jgi:microcystin-dependent protein
MEGVLGEIRMFGGNFAPQNWALCDGQLLRVDQNPALFSILGTIYGGDGRTTFALPDMRGLAPMHAGQAAGQPGRRLGEKGGNQIVADGKRDDTIRTTPYGVVNFIICVNGIFPSRG